MKKILLILLVFISFIKVNALSIDKMYIDSEIDISGNLLIKEVIEINNLNEDFDYKLYFKDMNLTLNDKNYYDGINISIENIGLLNEDYDLNLLNKDDFKKYIKESNDIETIKNDNNYSVKIKKNNKKTYIYIDYMVLSLSVIHNDIAEFCKTENQPVFLTKNGEGDLVVMSMEAYSYREEMLDLLEKLLEAEAQRLSGAKTFTLDEVNKQLEDIINGSN